MNPEDYTIEITREENDGEVWYVGKVKEFPSVITFEFSTEEAREGIIKIINKLYNMYTKNDEEFPQPLSTKKS